MARDELSKVAGWVEVLVAQLRADGWTPRTVQIGPGVLTEYPRLGSIFGLDLHRNYKLPDGEVVIGVVSKSVQKEGA